MNLASHLASLELLEGDNPLVPQISTTDQFASILSQSKFCQKCCFALQQHTPGGVTSSFALTDDFSNPLSSQHEEAIWVVSCFPRQICGFACAFLGDLM